MSVPAVYLGAEQAFGLADIVTDLRQVTGSIPCGPWLADRAGTPVAGALGLLVDDVLGYSIVGARPAGRWPVSSENTFDVVRPLDPRSEGPVRASTTGTVRTDALGGHVSGTVTDASGQVVATCSQRGRWIAFDGDFEPDTTPPLALGAACLEDLIGGAPTPVEGGAVLRLSVGRTLTNPLGNLHGGLSLCAADLVASAAVQTWDVPWSTESLRIQYLRPVPAGSDIEFTATVRHVGRTRAVVDVSGTARGRLCITAHLAGHPVTR